jgi:hypothetical protein
MLPGLGFIGLRPGCFTGLTPLRLSIKIRLKLELEGRR